MKKFILVAFSAALVSAGAATAEPLNNSYISVLGGWSSHPALSIGGGQNGMENGYNLGARVGTYLDGMSPIPGFSLEADYLYNRSQYTGTGAQLASSSFMGDLIYHVSTNSPFGIYGGAGVGAVDDNLNGTLHGSSTVLGWQALGGAEYTFTPRTSVFAEYRYQNAHGADIGALRDVGNTSNNLSLGLKFHL